MSLDKGVPQKPEIQEGQHPDAKAVSDGASQAALDQVRQVGYKTGDRGGDNTAFRDIVTVADARDSKFEAKTNPADYAVYNAGYKQWAPDLKSSVADTFAYYQETATHPTIKDFNLQVGNAVMSA